MGRALSRCLSSEGRFCPVVGDNRKGCAKGEKGAHFFAISLKNYIFQYLKFSPCGKCISRKMQKPAFFCIWVCKMQSALRGEGGEASRCGSVFAYKYKDISAFCLSRGPSSAFSPLFSTSGPEDPASGLPPSFWHSLCCYPPQKGFKPLITPLFTAKDGMVKRPKTKDDPERLS